MKTAIAYTVLFIMLMAIAGSISYAARNMIGFFADNPLTRGVADAMTSINTAFSVHMGRMLLILAIAAAALILLATTKIIRGEEG